MIQPASLEELASLVEKDGKKVSGIKRHIAVDTQGLPHALAVRRRMLRIEKAAWWHWNVGGIILVRYKKSLLTVVTRVRPLLRRYRS